MLRRIYNRIFKNHKENKKCKCGKNNVCASKLHSTDNGKLYTKTNEHFKCGTVRKQVSNMKKWWDKNP